MLRKPRNARTGRLADWKFFFQIYLVRDQVNHLGAIAKAGVGSLWV